MEEKIKVGDFDYLVPEGQKAIGLITEGNGNCGIHFKDDKCLEIFEPYFQTLLYNYTLFYEKSSLPLGKSPEEGDSSLSEAKTEDDE